MMKLWSLYINLTFQLLKYMVIFQTYLGVAAEYDGDRFITLQDGVWKVSQQGVVLAVQFYLS